MADFRSFFTDEPETEYVPAPSGPVSSGARQFRNALPNPDLDVPIGKSITHDLVDRTGPATFGGMTRGSERARPDILTPVGYAGSTEPQRRDPAAPRASQIAEAPRQSTAGAKQPTHREAERRSAAELEKFTIANEVNRIEQQTRRFLRHAKIANAASPHVKSAPFGHLAPHIHVPKSIEAMERYLDGTGGVVRYDPAWMLQNEGLRAPARLNEQRYVEWITGRRIPKKPEERIFERPRALHDGQTFTAGTPFEAAYGFDKDETSDHHLLLGTGYVSSRGRFEFTRKGNSIEVRGVVDQKIDDPFDWNKGQVTRFGAYEIRHDDMILLSRFGKARVFTVRSDWRRAFTGRIRIEPDVQSGQNRILGLEAARWTDAK